MNARTFRCPVCWEFFDIGDAMHIARHAELVGDPLLGEAAAARFLATRFDDDGRALDGFGLSCPDVACPHCRRKLADRFFEARFNILSLIGAPSAGKSYFLSVLSKVLPEVLFRETGAVMQDAEPAGNAPLTEMRNQLFGALSPERMALAKTQLDGAMYERLPWHGRTVSLPRPFTFLVTPASGTPPFGLVFYDNAGEHFLPGVDLDQSPGALHVAASDGFLFLFDPLSHAGFRRWLSDASDPQLSQDVLDQQETLLTEMGARLRRLRKLASDGKTSVPLALMIGKSDVWLPALESAGHRMMSAHVDGRLDPEAIAHNSALLRSLLLQLAPAVVASAESLCADVCYFAVSSLGHSPVRLADGLLAPTPGTIDPRDVEVPAFWLLDRLGLFSNDRSDVCAPSITLK